LPFSVKTNRFYHANGNNNESNSNNRPHTSLMEGNLTNFLGLFFILQNFFDYCRQQQQQQQAVALTFPGNSKVHEARITEKRFRLLFCCRLLLLLSVNDKPLTT